MPVLQRHADSYLPTGCQEKAEGGGCGQRLVGMATAGSCWSCWCWRSDHSGMDPSPGEEKEGKGA